MMHSQTTFSSGLLRGLTLTMALGAVVFTAGCGGGDDAGDAPATVSLNLNLPDSLTGGAAPAAPVAMVIHKAASSADVPCAFLGTGDDDDVFRNGYNMTKFMVSAVAAWTCIADTIIEMADTVPHDGAIHETQNDTTADNYDADDPTHYLVTNDSETQTTARVYFGYDRAAPPAASDTPELFISWNKAANGDITGRLIIDVVNLNPDGYDPEGPIMMRTDFNYTTFAKIADMYLQFDNGNQWADGLRIQVAKDLTASAAGQVFTARGLMNMKDQFLPVDGITELPQLRMYTVSDRLGEGAAVAEFVDVALALQIDANDHLGNYLFAKTDRYFFDSNQSWDWIDKSITRSEYRGARALTDYTLDDIVAFLNDPNPTLDPAYFDTNCINVGDDCNDFLNAIFADGFADQEPNQGADPDDWRSTAVADPDYLTTVYPNGTDWTDAFDPVFTP